MRLLLAENLRLAFGARVILDDDTVQVAQGARIGLVGANGTGKSTLLRILAGARAPDSGTVSRQKGCRVAYLPQDVLELPSGRLIDSVLEAVPGRSQVEAAIGQVEQDLAAVKDVETQMRCAERLADLHEELARVDQNFSRHAAERILTGLGFRTEDLERNSGELSGGWKMRAALAGLLFSAPDVLLLDEPTNHLDLPSVRWLDEFLRNTKLALVLVCHDREFLNRHVRHILSFEPEGLRNYSGNYDLYVKQRAQEEEVLLSAAANQERERREAERFIDRFRAQASKARAVQSRIKRLEKMPDIILLRRRKAVRPRFPAVAPSSALVIAVEGISKAFGPERLYEDARLTVKRSDRVAIVGVNGAGKTTLLRIIAGEVAADSGSVRFGHGVTLAYYAQHHADALTPTCTIVEELASLVPSWSSERLRTLLGAFLFSGEDVDKPISVLSGGEKARVALAKLLVRPGNLLLMDEPTNHLDTASSEALAEALEAFEGTVVFVSHNLSFARRLATKVWDIVDGKIVEYPGTLGDYLEKLAKLEKVAKAEQEAKYDVSALASAPEPKSTASAAQGAQDHSRRKALVAAEKSRHRGLSQLRRQAETLEIRIAEIEREQKGTEAHLADPAVYRDRPRAVDLLATYERARDKIEELMERWQHTLEQIQEIETRDR